LLITSGYGCNKAAKNMDSVLSCSAFLFTKSLNLQTASDCCG
jgi:hypothetical protein